MTSETNIELLFKAVKSGDKDLAKKYAEKANEEVKMLLKLKSISPPGKKALEYIKKLIKSSSGEKLKEAQMYMDMYNEMYTGYSGHLKQYIKVGSSEEGTTSKDELVGKQYNNHGPNYQGSVEDKVPYKTLTNTFTISQSTDDKLKFSESVDGTSANVEVINCVDSRKMKQNCINYSNLHPSEIAKTFHDLYNDEWTEACDYLCNSQRLDERLVIQVLLKILQIAYGFCTKESEQQIKAMNEKIFLLLKYGTEQTQNPKDADQVQLKESDLVLLKEFRKTHAFLAISGLQKKFYDSVMKSIHLNELRGIPPQSEDGQLAVYAKKTIVLSWMMVVHDPPLYMCPTEKEGFDPNMYSAFLQNGTKLDFFVWPALKLAKNGSVVAKGVVKFKS